MRMKIAYVPLSSIRPAEFNPPGRTSATAILTLEADIRDDGGVLVPIHLVRRSDYYVIADGHRRFEVMKKLGYPDIPAVVHSADKNVGQLWARLNRLTRSVNALEWMEAWHRSNMMVDLPPSVRSAVDRCAKVFGPGGIEYLIEFRTTPHAVKAVDLLFPEFEKRDLLSGITRPSMARWVVRHHLSAPIRMMFMRPPGPTKRILQKVRAKIIADEAFDLKELFLGIAA